MKPGSNRKRLLFVSSLLPLIMLMLQSCHSDDSNSYYTARDFYKVKKFDVHAHDMRTRPDFVLQAKADNFKLINLNTEVPDYPPIDSQQYVILQLRHKYPNDIYYNTTFSTVHINEPGWADSQLVYLKNSFDSGAVGIKVWKNIGMTIKDKDSNFIMIDNPVFDPIFNYLEQHHIPVIGHLGEPKNCWLPLDQMTTRNDSAYYAAYPEYHMYLHPNYPSYQDQINARDHLLEKHPNLRFVGAHLASLEWSVDEIAKRLDKFPNMMVEPAQRFGQVQYQTLTNWKKVRDFFIKYQDRIMYGTDLEDNGSMTSEELRKNLHETWMREWLYLTSGDSMATPYLNQKVKGLHLPKSVIDNIYYINPERFYFHKNVQE